MTVERGVGLTVHILHCMGGIGLPTRRQQAALTMMRRNIVRRLRAAGMDAPEYPDIQHLLMLEIVERAA